MEDNKLPMDSPKMREYMESDKKKTKFYVRVSEKSSKKDVDALVILAHQKRWAERIGLLCCADEFDYKSSELESRSEVYFREKEHGKITPETHQYVIVGKCDPEQLEAQKKDEAKK